MIEKIIIKNNATFDEKGAEISAFKAVNFIYGANGSGKTTISRVVRTPNLYKDSSVDWKNNQVLKTFVYNSDFIDETLESSSEINGVFTMGEDASDIYKKIKEENEKKQKNEDKLINLKKNLLEKGEEKEKIEKDFETICWDMKGKYENDFGMAFGGLLNSKKKFKDKCESEFTNTSELLKYEELSEKAKQIFHSKIVEIQKNEHIVFEQLGELETNNIFKTKIIGKDDIDIADLIKKLNNSDWVRQGTDFLNISDKLCPFCQQELPVDLQQKLNDYFDENYKKQLYTIKKAHSEYEKYLNDKIEGIQKLIKESSSFLNNDKIEDLKGKIEVNYKANLLKLERKLKEPSLSIELDSVVTLFKEIEDEIKTCNEKIDKNNLIVNNLKNEKKNISNQIWKFIISCMEKKIKEYVKNLKNIQNAIKNFEKSIEEKQNNLKENDIELSKLENKIISIKPTISAINSTLKGFGFSGFKLEESKKKPNMYIIVRENGKKVEHTLSEGEKTFITFLYFYNLIKGSINNTLITENRVVVIDDPISSLDSDVLFIVSNLIRELIIGMRNKESNIKQLFVMTHNIYFYKEVTFNKGKGKDKLKDETFWVIYKNGNISTIKNYLENPIKSSYEFMWEELKEKHETNNITIHNTLRRILENYFKIQGDKDWQEIINKFEGEEINICSSLISWLQDGSHNIYEDLYIDCNTALVEKYLSVFKKIFIKTGHEAHYKMMMCEE